MDTGSGSFSGSGSNQTDLSAIKKDIADLKAVTGAASSTIVPVEGGAYTVAATDRTINLVNLEPAGNLNEITINLPTGRLGQRLFVHSSAQIASVTFALPGGVVDNWQVMFSTGDSVDFTYSKANNWSRGVS